jgi:membrane associated rhomboid family serine protease
MIPIRDQTPIRHIPWANYLLIAIASAAFVYELSVTDLKGFLMSWGFTPGTLTLTDPLGILPVFTSIFLHGGLLHLVTNMWFLTVFGNSVEDRIGPIRYFILFLASGVAAAAAQYVTGPHSPIPVIGASGAISGIIGAYFVWFSRSRIETLLILFPFFPLVSVPSRLFLGYWFLIQLVNGVGSLAAAGGYVGGTAWFAHVGGFLFGFLVASFWRQTRRM